MEKRVLLAVLLSFIVLFGYQVMFPPPPLPPAFEATPPASSDPPPPSASAGTTVPAGEAIAEASVEAEPTLAADREQDVVVETSTVRALFSTRGGGLKSWRLKQYRDSDGEPLDLVPVAVPEADRPFTLALPEDAALSATLRRALFKPSAEHVDAASGDSTLTFEYRDAAGLDVVKQFSFFADRPYLIGFSAVVSKGGAALNPTIAWGPALGTGVIGGGMMYNPPSQPTFYRNEDVTRLSIDDLGQRKIEEGSFQFVGADDHYFMSAALETGPARVEYRPVRVSTAADEKGLQFIDWSIQYAQGPKDARFFFGPKDFDELKAISPELTYAIDFGVFRPLVVPLLNALKWVHGYVGNYGWSIVVLTVLINLVMFPLRHKSVVSMRRMQELQPEVKAIQERYAKLKLTDPARQKLNQELMNLYRERGVNPASGCVPMLLTFPVLFAFYAMLSVAIEIRGAPFFGWIQDLAAYDPYFIWPVIMGATMIVQQKMTPAAITDPMQQKMMMMMPIVFTIMLAWAPSGLVLYWTASNVWTIGQQAVTNKIIGPPAQHTVRPPAERRVKNAGSGKSGQAKERR